MIKQFSIKKSAVCTYLYVYNLIKKEENFELDAIIEGEYHYIDIN